MKLKRGVWKAFGRVQGCRSYERWVDSALEGRPHLLLSEKQWKAEGVLLASARGGLAPLFVPLLMDKSLPSDSQLLHSFFRECGCTMTHACVPQFKVSPRLLHNHTKQCTHFWAHITNLRLLTQVPECMCIVYRYAQRAQYQAERHSFDNRQIVRDEVKKLQVHAELVLYATLLLIGLFNKC